MPRPLLFLDVDGPLIPFGRTSGAYRTFTDADLGPQPRALGCDLLWATTWLEDANECVAPLAGLPPLPVLDFPDDNATGPGRHWKTPPIVERAAGRAFVWIDDETTDVDRAWVAGHHPGPALLHTVAPSVGLTTGDLGVIAEWLIAVA